LENARLGRGNSGGDNHKPSGGGSGNKVSNAIKGGAQNGAKLIKEGGNAINQNANNVGGGNANNNGNNNNQGGNMVNNAINNALDKKDGDKK
jgi:hypothetical protein